MSSARRTFVWMGAFSIITLALGLAREFVIVRDLRASGAADFFFRGLIIVGATRNFGTSLFRARWIPVGPGVEARTLLRGELATIALVTVVAIAALGVVMPLDAWSSPTAWLFVCAVPMSVTGSAVRGLAERAGLEARGFVLEWSLPIGTMVGALVIGHGALGPAAGLAVGLAVGLGLLAPTVFGREGAASHAQGHARGSQQAIRWLLFDTLAYVNLGLLDGGLSRFIYDEGGLARLTYALMFVNAALAVPMAASTVVSLRIAASGEPSAHRRLRRWAMLAGLVVAVAVGGVYLALTWETVTSIVDAAAGWAFCAAIAPIVGWSVPFAALRLMNTVGRQYRVAHDPRGLLPWDLVGLAGRTVVLVIGASLYGPVASPIALAFAELVQVGAWFRTPKAASPPAG